MARIFTVSFLFDDVTYNTLVSVRTTPFYMEYILPSLDQHLLAQLPGNKIISPSFRNFLFPNANEAHSKELMKAITDAVMLHLQAVSS